MSTVFSQAVPKLKDRGWFWIDDDVRNYAREIEELKPPKARCIQVSPKGTGVLEELREGLETLGYEEVATALSGWDQRIRPQIS